MTDEKTVFGLPKKTLEAWLEPPTGVVTGPCGDPRCELPQCLTPRSSVQMIRSESYTGPLVIVTYSFSQHDHWIRLNGRDIAFKAAEIETLEAFLASHGGALAHAACLDHLYQKVARPHGSDLPN